MTAPFVATVTKQPSGLVGRSRLQRGLLIAALLLPLLLAIALLAWMAVPKTGEGDSRASWMSKLFGGEGSGLRRIELEKAICSLPKDIGPCRGAKPRFFYSTESGTCEPFLYGGCDGNANNFEAIDECTSHCGGQPSGSGERKALQQADCSLPKKIGPCRGAMPRFFYSTESGTCEPFLYGGCNGNVNNFETIDECTSHCGSQPSGSGESRALQQADCSLPKDIGPCRGAMPRFFYSTESGTCEPFLYGGCDGNVNNFETIDECTSHCGSQATGSDKDARQENSAAICTLPSVTGDCRAAMPRYFYDAETSTCKEFTYGGCGGNGNNFETLHDCEKMCSSAKSGSSSTSDCSSEPDGGRCMAYMERYAYHPATRSCQKFVYGGCSGNGNRYSTKQECEEHCAHSGDRVEQVELVEGAGGGKTNLPASKVAILPENIVIRPHIPTHANEKETSDYDTKVCGVPECPMDCGHVRREGDCVYCHCAHTPFTEPGQLVVPADQPCPPGHSLLRSDHGSNVCTMDPSAPLSAV